MSNWDVQHGVEGGTGWAGYDRDLIVMGHCSVVRLVG